MRRGRAERPGDPEHGCRKVHILHVGVRLFRLCRRWPREEEWMLGAYDALQIRTV